jgi:hypothetical protein
MRDRNLAFRFSVLPTTIGFDITVETACVTFVVDTQKKHLYEKSRGIQYSMYFNVYRTP